MPPHKNDRYCEDKASESRAISKIKAVKCFVPIDLYEESKYISNPKAFIDAKLSVDSTVIIPCVKYNAVAKQLVISNEF